VTWVGWQGCDFGLEVGEGAAAGADTGGHAGRLPAALHGTTCLPAGRNTYKLVCIVWILYIWVYRIYFSDGSG
jgi:hypothetical protein